MKTRTGYLVKRGDTFYACWTIGGKKFRQSTHKSDKREAQQNFPASCNRFLVEDEVRTLETVKARIEGAKAELATLDEQRNPPLTIRKHGPHTWRHRTDPDTGPSTLEKYEGKFNRFAAWMGERAPRDKGHARRGRKNTSKPMRKTCRRRHGRRDVQLAYRIASSCVAGCYARRPKQNATPGRSFEETDCQTGSPGTHD